MGEIAVRGWLTRVGGRSVNHARGGLAVDYKRSFCCVVSRCLTRVQREGVGREGVL